MIEEVIKYKASICNTVYDELVQATDCERKGIIPLHPIGTIYNMYKDPDMVFAVIKQMPNNYKHHHSYLTWACRDTSAGDNCGGDDYCGFDSWDKIYSPDKTTPAYKRMLQALHETKIKPIDYKEKI